MPTYEYRCDSCGYSFEKFQGMSEEPVKKCPECGSEVRRVPGGGAGIIFKGKGFYQTDYKSGRKPSDPDGDSGGKDKCGSAGECPCG